MSSRSFLALTLLAVLVAGVVTPVLAQTPVAQLQAAGSEISFTTKQMGVPVEGKFGKFSAQITLDPKKPESGNVSFNIDTGSARFGSTELDLETPKATWLNVPKFPQASFQSTSLKAAGPGKFEVAGKLNIKGSTQNVVVPVAVTQAAGGNGAISTATGSFVIKRLDFKIGEGEWTDTSMLGNDVVVKFKLQLTGMAAL
jgi:polyisoprenoid-binding protein YceI